MDKNELLKLKDLLDELLDTDPPKAYRMEIINILTYVEGKIEESQ